MKNNMAVVPVMLGKSFPLTAQLLYSFARMGKVRFFPRRAEGKNHAKNLSIIYFKLTPVCNLRCVMCGQYGDQGVMHDRIDQEAEKTLPLETWKGVVDQIASYKPITYLWGGEPFLYPGLLDLAKYIVDKGLYMSLNTNGTLIEKHAERIVRDKWGTIFVSLDAFREVNDSLRGAGSYDKVIAGFEAINREKKRRNSKLPILGVVSVVTNRNYQDIANLSRALRDYGVEFHIINMGTYTNDKIIEDHKKVMREKLDMDIDCLAGYNTGYNLGIDTEKFYQTLQEIHSSKGGPATICSPSLNPDKLAVYYNDLTTPVRNGCIVPWCQANVNYNGDVHFCADYPDYILGNINEKPFAEIYNGERANRFRRVISSSEGGIIPSCLRCYQNMLFGNKIKGF
jgi:radical SAM protein with 4Fe4S-binding SPASM domain